MQTTTATIAAEIAPKLISNPKLIAAAAVSPEAYAAALEAELPAILKQHGEDVQRAFAVLEHKLHMEPRTVTAHFAPRIYKAVHEMKASA